MAKRVKSPSRPDPKRKTARGAPDKRKATMALFAKGELKSGRGGKSVKSSAQAYAIAMSSGPTVGSRKGKVAKKRKRK